MLPRIFLMLIVLALLGGCVTGPGYDSERYRVDISPEQVSSDFESYRNSEVLWGGVLVSVTNMEKVTQLEVLAYPLKSNQFPDTDGNPTGRFLVIRDGYLEPVDYAPGRTVTVTGQLGEARESQVGSAEYIFPVVRPDQIHLWPRGSENYGPVWHFGVGVGVGF